MRTPIFVALLLIGLLIHAVATVTPHAEALTLRGWPLFDLHFTAELERWTAALPSRAALLVKLPGLALSAMLSIIAYQATSQRIHHRAAAQWAALACWLNPALILSSDVLGFPDLWAAVPVVLALLLAHGGAYFAAGVFSALGVLMLPHACALVPPVLVAALSLRGDGGALRVLSGIAAGIAGLLAPSVVSQGIEPIRLALAVWLPAPGAGLVNAQTLWVPATSIAHRVPVPRLAWMPPVRLTRWLTAPVIGATTAVLIVLRACWQSLRTPALSIHAAFGALIVQALVTVVPGVPVHSETLAIGPLACAAALRPGFRPVFYAVTLVSTAGLLAGYPGDWPHVAALVARFGSGIAIGLGVAHTLVLIWLMIVVAGESGMRTPSYTSTYGGRV